MAPLFGRSPILGQASSSWSPTHLDLISVTIFYFRCLVYQKSHDKASKRIMARQLYFSLSLCLNTNYESGYPIKLFIIGIPGTENIIGMVSYYVMYGTIHCYLFV